MPTVYGGCHEQKGISVKLSLRNIANIMYSKEDLIFKALKVRPQREVRFCKKIDDDFLEMLNRKKPKILKKLKISGMTEIPAENMNIMMIRGIMP